MELVECATIDEASVAIKLKREALAARLLGEVSQKLDLDGTIRLEAPLRVMRRGGVETKPAPAALLRPRLSHAAATGQD